MTGIICRVYTIFPDESHQEGFLRAILEQNAEIHAALDNAAGSPDLAVHTIRKCIKRIRAGLRAARGLIEKSSYQSANYAYRDLGRQFSQFRDEAVLSETLGIVYLRAEYEPEFCAYLEGELQQGRTTHTERMAWFTAERVAALHAQAESAEALVRTLDILRGEPEQAAIGIRRTAARAAAGFRAAYRPPESAHKFHEWRKQVKYLWHQCELFSRGESAVYPCIADLKHLSDQLGFAHDAAELESWLIERAPAGGQAVDVLCGDVRRFRMDCEGAARPHGRALFNGAVSDLVQTLISIN